MEIEQHYRGDTAELRIAGRLDAYWAAHLSTDLDSLLRQGYHRIVLDFAAVEFLSSAGIGVLLKYYKILAAVNGSLTVVNPRELVKNVLDLSGVTPYLIKSRSSEVANKTSVAPERFFERAGHSYRLQEMDASAELTCRIIGEAAGGTRRPVDSFTVSFPDDSFAIGIGAHGRDFEDCRERFGELLSVAGVTFHLPTVGSTQPDYDAVGKEAQMLHGLLCGGGFSHQFRFDAGADGEEITMNELLEVMTESLGEECATAGFVMLAETAGLVGAWLKRSPAACDAETFFRHPEIREHIGYALAPMYARSSAWLAGVVAKDAGGALATMLRPSAAGSQLSAHVHALALSYRHIPKGKLDLAETVETMFDPEVFDAESLLGMLHLVNDERPAVGRGQSAFHRGVCWAGPVRSFRS